MKDYHIQLLHQQRHIRHDNQISLLSALEQQGIFPEYQCRAGHCGSCRIKMKKGKVSYKETPLAFLNPDEILLCCCQVEEDLELEL
ncbi:class I ribonucleotide reductase maintenance protein YfaE [[Pasteurella] aerogenes]|nr:class I ribonucleotide reductase maintenance protein YfaE [[Pasteurella] aerogenes]MCI7717401.1 class I ribonucleotide reductase maintenance protein YfaE [[Pasteurella] aerogenes]MCU9997728.1 2Fe-2S ferredoxin-like protein [[Pasteurella] aerogenes]MDY4480101.1 class I ribonucleotide reductase maintenance protein YfaE [[Pasteurella] aerogenes]MDY4595164.1 class I ribonucleotide reductase maintenance protein YfaE [[Pasteurella] aerogenes]